jgi:hypothetical protein
LPDTKIVVQKVTQIVLVFRDFSITLLIKKKTEGSVLLFISALSKFSKTPSQFWTILAIFLATLLKD